MQSMLGEPLSQWYLPLPQQALLWCLALAQDSGACPCFLQEEEEEEKGGMVLDKTRDRVGTLRGRGFGPRRCLLSQSPNRITSGAHLNGFPQPPPHPVPTPSSVFRGDPAVPSLTPDSPQTSNQLCSFYPEMKLLKRSYSIVHFQDTLRLYYEPGTPALAPAGTPIWGPS